MNLPNRLTLSRLALTVFFVVCLSWPMIYGRTFALILFILASVTDYFDGQIARRYGIVTKFGKLMDPLADKVMIAAGFICLVPRAIPAWVATIVVARDFLITGLRLLASAEGVILPAERMGKHKTSWQIVTVIFFLLLLSATEIRPNVDSSRWWQTLWTYGGNTLLWITIGLTIYSGLGYLWANRGLIIDPISAQARHEGRDLPNEKSQV